MTVRIGDTGPVVAEIRSRLARAGFLPASAPDGSADDACFDAALDAAVRAFQQERGLTVDGIVGRQTFRRLEEARWRLGDRVLVYTAGHLLSGDDVTELQRHLSRMGFDCGRVDGLFGPQTDRAVREFQRGVGVTPDGTCGSETFRALDRLVRQLGDREVDDLRQGLTHTASRSGVTDKVVVLDPAPDGLGDVERALLDDLAARIEGRLLVLGTSVFLTRAAGAPEPHTAPAAFANSVAADLLVSLHIDTWPSPRASGVATFYFGDPLGGAHSFAGRVAAEEMLRQVCERTDLVDCRAMPRTWDVLRATRMPAVCLELGYAHSAADMRRLEAPEFRDVVADAVADAVVAFFAPEDSTS